MAWSSPLPVGVRVGSNFGPRGGTLHAGDDFPPKVSGTQGVPVHAIGDGEVVKTGSGNVLPYHSGNGILIDHGKGIRSYYGHLASIGVKAGQKVKGGAQIGVMGHTGNVWPAGKNGTHVHLGLLVNGTYIDPSIWLANKGIVVGKTAPVTATTPAPAPAKPGTSSTDDNKGVQRALQSAGYYRGDIDGVNGALQRAAVEGYQRANTLVADGYWGPTTQTYFDGVKRWQTALNIMRSDYPDLRVDGDWGPVMVKTFKHIEARNGFSPQRGRSYPAFRKFITVTTGVSL